MKGYFKIIRVVMLPLLLFFVCFCCSNKSLIGEIKFKKINNYKVKIDVNYSNNLEAFNGFYKVVTIQDTIYFYFLDWDSKKIIFHDIKTGNVIKVVDLNNFTNITFNKRTDIVYYSKNRIAIFSDKEQILSIITTSGELLKQISVSKLTGIKPFVTVSYGNLSMNYEEKSNSFLIQIAYLDLVLTDKEKFSNYFSRPLLISVNLDSNKVDFLPVLMPKINRKGSYFGSFGIYKEIVNKDKFVFSFSSSDSLFFFNLDDNSIESKLCRFNESTGFKEFDLNKINNLSYLRKYHIEESNYKNIVFHDSERSFYRIFEKGQNYLTKTGEVVDFTSIPWGVLKMNIELEVVGQYYFDELEYTNKTFVPTIDGIIISRKSSDKLNSVVEFDVIKLITHE